MGQPDREDKVRLQSVAAAVLTAESGRAILWFPVGLALGISIYFALDAEPPVWTGFAVVLPLGALIVGGPFLRRAATVLALVAGLSISLGYGAAMLHAHLAKAPALAAMIETGVEGRVLELGRSSSGSPRVVLDRVRLFGVEPAATPERVRVSLGEPRPDGALPTPGERIRVQARLFPPGSAVEPGAFDFHLQAHFKRIGGVGYALGPALFVPADVENGLLDRAFIALGRLRARIANSLRATLPGPEGAFAAAILVGDRSGIEEPEQEALRAANLSHLLAISGLHMGILCGLVFAGLRSVLALIPRIALHYPTKKIAAGAALLAGLGYLALSGGTVPTQRAFVMVAVALTAVLLDRPAITLRALGVAAVIVLLIRPVSLFDAGFQMSFAATVALVATFEALPLPSPKEKAPVHRRVLLYVVGIAATSFVAGLATGPFAAFHFNRIAMWGLPANLLALPVMGLWIAPMAVLAGLLAPLGLAGLPLAAMGYGIAAVLGVAEMVAAWPGAVRYVPAWSEWVPMLIGLGGLWLALWASALRFAGLAPILAGLWLSAHPPERPEVLIAPGARLIGVLGEGGRAIDHARAQSFAAETWLRRDADAAMQADAAKRPAMSHGRGWAKAALSDGWQLEVIHSLRPDRAAVAALCQPRTLLVVRHGGAISGSCCFLGATEIARHGAIAVRIDNGIVHLSGTRGSALRLWDRGPTGPAVNRCE